MRFLLIDRIVEVVPGQRLQAVKYLTLGEEYLADHFPTFPVMPGVLMLEALVQAGAWLLRLTENFSYSVVVLREAKGVKYGTFIEPGRVLRLTVEKTGKNTGESQKIEFKGSGEVDGVNTVAARFVLEQYNLGDRDAALAPLDEQMKEYYRRLYLTLRPRETLSARGMAS